MFKKLLTTIVLVCVSATVNLAAGVIIIKDGKRYYFNNQGALERDARAGEKYLEITVPPSMHLISSRGGSRAAEEPGQKPAPVPQSAEDQLAEIHDAIHDMIAMIDASLAENPLNEDGGALEALEQEGVLEDDQQHDNHSSQEPVHEEPQAPQRALWYQQLYDACACNGGTIAVGVATFAAGFGLRVILG